jgi:hypothetical protein
MHCFDVHRREAIAHGLKKDGMRVTVLRGLFKVWSLKLHVFGLLGILAVQTTQ